MYLFLYTHSSGSKEFTFVFSRVLRIRRCRPRYICTFQIEIPLQSKSFLLEKYESPFITSLLCLDILLCHLSCIASDHLTRRRSTQSSEFRITIRIVFLMYS